MDFESIWQIKAGEVIDFNAEREKRGLPSLLPQKPLSPEDLAKRTIYLVPQDAFEIARHMINVPHQIHEHNSYDAEVLKELHSMDENSSGTILDHAALIADAAKTHDLLHSKPISENDMMPDLDALQSHTHEHVPSQSKEGSINMVSENYWDHYDWNDRPSTPEEDSEYDYMNHAEDESLSREDETEGGFTWGVNNNAIMLPIEDSESIKGLEQHLQEHGHSFGHDALKNHLNPMREKMKTLQINRAQMTPMEMAKLREEIYHHREQLHLDAHQFGPSSDGSDGGKAHVHFKRDE